MKLFSEYKLVLGLLVREQYSFRKKDADGELNPADVTLSLDGKKSMFSGRGKGSARSLEEKKKVGKIIGFGFVGLYMLAIMIGATISFGQPILQAGLAVEFVTLLMGAAQFVVLFFGLFTSVNTLFYSKDTELLASLPISDRSVFLARFTMIYLNELLISTALLFPMLMTFGIFAAVSGFAVSPAYWVLIPLLLLMPVLPLLIVSIVIMPLFYIITFFKRRRQLGGIFTAIFFVLIIGLYFVVYYFSMRAGSATAGEDGSIMLGDGMVRGLKLIANVLYPDKVLAMSMFGIKVYANLPIFFAILIGAGVLALLLASAFYPRARSSAFENSGEIAHNEKGVSMEKDSFVRTFIMKEWKMWKRESTLLLSTLMTLFMPAIMTVFMTILAFGDIEGVRSEFMSLGMGLMFACMLSASNYPSLIPFSFEGANIYILKTLPIDVDKLVKCKTGFANCVTIIGSVLTSIALAAVLKRYFWVGILCLPVIILSGVSNNTINIMRDMKSPKLKWQNVTELTKNNTRFLLPILLNMVSGMVTFIVAIVLMTVDQAGAVIPTAGGLCIVVAVALLGAIVTALFAHKAANVDTRALFDAME